MTKQVMSISWKVDPRELGKAIERQYAGQIVRRTREVMRDAAPEAEGYMKVNAPWTDRTGEARKLLMAETIETADDVTLYLIHGAAYGVWLELRNGGRYAIIAPAVHETASRLRARLKGLVR